MDKVYVGKIVNTHGIKGELRILSSFEWKEKVFVVGKKLYIGKKLEEVEITSYRKHKNFDMVTFKGYSNINEVLRFKGLSVYVDRDSLELKDDEYLLDDLIGFKVLVDGVDQGVVKGFRTLAKGDLLIELERNGKIILVPYLEPFIDKIELSKKEIHLVNMKGLF